MKRRVINVLGTELRGKTLLIIGLGATASEAAKRVKSFGMKVIAVTKHPDSKKTTLVGKSRIHKERHDVVVDDIRGLESLSETISKAGV